MVALKRFRTLRLLMLLLQFFLGNSYLLLPADHTSASRTDFYMLVAIPSGSLLLTTLATAVILLSARAVAANSPAKARPAAAGCKQGVASLSFVQRLRALLALASALSAASTVVAVFTFELGFQYRKGRASGLFASPAWILLFILGLEQGICTGLLMCVED